MMRVLYLHQYFTTPSMPGGTRSYEFGRRLVDSGHDVHLITADLRALSGPSTTIEAGITVHWLPVAYSQAMPFRRRIVSFFSYAFRSAFLACRLGGDVVFASSTPLTVAIPGLIVKRWLSIPLVFEVRDLWPHVPIAMGIIRNPLVKSAARLLERTAYRGASRIITLSPDNKRAIVADGNDASKIVVIPNACDTESFAPSGTRESALRAQYDWLKGRPLVVYTGTIGAVNDVPYLVRVAASMERINPDIRFLIVGNGSHADTVRALAAQLGILNRTLFMMPAVPKADIIQVLHVADLAVSTVSANRALWPNSANKVFDAWASGTPVAINHGGWLAQVLKDSGAGLVMPPEDAQRAAHLVNDHLTDSDWLDSAKSAAANLSRGEFARESLFSRFHDTLSGAVSDSACSSSHV